MAKSLLSYASAFLISLPPPSDEATDDDLRRAYRKLAVKYHPDKQKEQDAEVSWEGWGVGG